MSELYDLPIRWKYVKLTEVVEKEKISIKRGPFGSALKKSFFVESGYKVYEQKNAIRNDFSIGEYYINEEKFNELKGFEVKGGDIIISCSGTIGKIAVAPLDIEKGIINQALLKLTLNKDIIDIKYFVNFWIDYVNKGMSEESTKGAAIKNIASVKVLKDLDIPLPSLDEQQRIVSKLDNLFEKIDKAIELHQKNIDEANVFMGSVLNDVFGELEEKYEKKTIGSFSKVGTGVTPLKSRDDYYKNGNINWITSKATNDDLVYESEQLVTDVALRECRLKLNPIGTLIVALYGQGKTRGQVSELMIETTTNQALATILVDDKQAINRYLKYFLKKSYLDLREKASGGTQPNLNLTIIKNTELPFPPKKIQDNVVAYLNKVSQKIEKVKSIQKEKMENLKALKASILDKVFKGKL